VKENVKVILSIPVPFPFAGPPVEAFFKDLLKQQDIVFLNNHEVKKVDGTTVYFDDISGGSPVPTTIKADLLLATFPQRAPDFVKPLCNPQGYIPVDLQTNKVKSVVGVYAIGDACHTMFPKPNKPHPKAGEFAYMMGVHVATQIISNIKAPGSAVAPPLRRASCVAECGVAGKGVNIQPDFSEILSSPETGMPKFNTPIVDGAADEKIKWVNGYLHKFLVKGKVVPFGSSNKVDTSSPSASADGGGCCLIS
jgi:NADPH-dependent 2,4-dienoyl-CoA reductase/sulfur reductase-like enzyme